MSYLFTSESVSEGHPDKLADQISDALLDEFLRQDPDSKVACETSVTTGMVFLFGEVRSNAWVDAQTIARNVINKVGYTKSDYMFDGNACGVISAIHEQSPDIRQGVVREKPEEQGAGDQGMMFGYAVRETGNYMPYSIELSHFMLQVLADIRREGKVMTYLRPDAKSQVTVEYDDNNVPVGVHTVLISTQHDDFIKPVNNTPEAQKEADEKMLSIIKNDIQNILIPRVKSLLPEKEKAFFKDDYKLLVNPTGKFVIGGPHGDSGLTGRKIIVDTYGGKGAHGGGAFSGKDPSKVDRSAAYAMRHIAKNMIAAGVCDEVLVQVAYAIGVAEPVSMYINTYGTAKVKDEKGNVLKDCEIASKIREVFDLRPYAIVNRFGLKNPIFLPTASYGHFGRTPYKAEVLIGSNGNQTKKEVEFFAWEKLDYVEKVKQKFGI